MIFISLHCVLFDLNCLFCFIRLLCVINAVLSSRVEASAMIKSQTTTCTRLHARAAPCFDARDPGLELSRHATRLSWLGWPVNEVGCKSYSYAHIPISS